MFNSRCGTRRKFVYLNPGQLRLAERSVSDISGLAESIRYNGLLNPVTVRRSASGYEVICGARRYRAAMVAGLRKIPCLLLDVDDRTVATLRLTENIHHFEGDIFSLAEKTGEVMRQYNISYHEMAGLLGMSQPELMELLGMLRFTPEQRKKMTKNPKASIAKEVEKTPSTEPDSLKPSVTKKITDIRLYKNSLNRIVGVMRESGFNAKSTVSEDEGVFEFTLVASKQ
ncbi:MAG: ParB/RepB/Spo0J family partition protein [Clostridia bacterium]|nr:ParB/RepB/Spo0J family partition protein [Clostridia bacterium]